MAERGDVFRLKNRLGFVPKGEAGAVVVVQAPSLNAVLPTTLVVPLDVAGPYAADPTAVRVSRQESAAQSEQVALATQLRPLRLDYLAPGPVGRLLPTTLARLDRILRLVLGL